MFDAISITEIFAFTVSAVGDLFAILILGGAGACLIRVLLGAPRRHIAEPLFGSTVGIVIVGTGLFFKSLSPEMAPLDNGIIFPFSDVVMFLLLFAAAILVIATLVVSFLRGPATR